MIPIRIKNKKYKIKGISELTTKEYIELSKIENLDLVKYISWQTGFSMDDAFFAVTSKVVEDAIGVMPDIRKLPRPKGFDYSKTIITVGQRHQIERCGKEEMELLVFILAVAQACSTNIDDVNKLQAKYLEMPFAEILPAGFFFFKILQSGKKSEVRSLGKLWLLTKTLFSRKEQG